MQAMCVAGVVCLLSCSILLCSPLLIDIVIYNLCRLRLLILSDTCDGGHRGAAQHGKALQASLDFSSGLAPYKYRHSPTEQQQH